MLIPLHHHAGLTPLIRSSLGQRTRIPNVPEVIEVAGWGDDEVGAAFRIEAGEDTQKKLDQATAINGVAAVGAGLGGLLIGLILGYVLTRD